MSKQDKAFALNGELRTVTKSMFYGIELSKEVY